MDTLLFHPKVVHLPIALALLIPVVSVALLLAWVRDLLPRRTWVIALALQALLVVASVVAMRTGEGEEEVVERVVAESVIEEHEEAAELFTWTAAGVLLLFAAVLLLRDDRARKVAAVATLGSVVVLFLGYRVGERGGALVYKHGAASAYGTPAAGSPAAAHTGGVEDDDDDDDDD